MYSGEFANWKFKKISPSDRLDNMLRCILLCNDANKFKEKLLSPSQDELCLIEMVEKHYYCKFLSRDQEQISI